MHRVAEIRRLIGEMEFTHPVTLVEGRYDPEEFYGYGKRSGGCFGRRGTLLLSATVCVWKRQRNCQGRRI